MTPPDAKEALRRRQGAGARYDAAEAPHDALLQARRATARFARCLNHLADADLDAVVRRPAWTRRHVIAHVGYEARLLAALFRDAAQGRPAVAQPLPDIARAATLPARALRHLCDHTAIHLDVEWRDLPGPLWATPTTLQDGTDVLLRDIPDLRATSLLDGARIITMA